MRCWAGRFVYDIITLVVLWCQTSFGLRSTAWSQTHRLFSHTWSPIIFTNTTLIQFRSSHFFSHIVSFTAFYLFHSVVHCIYLPVLFFLSLCCVDVMVALTWFMAAHQCYGVLQYRSFLSSVLFSNQGEFTVTIGLTLFCSALHSNIILFSSRM